MNFESPLLLLGLLGLIPIIVLHLKPSRQREIPFPAIEILRHVLLRHQQRTRLQSLLMLILRATLWSTFVLAAARPNLMVWRPGGIRTGPRLAQVIVLDDSASMSRIDSHGKSAFETAREMALMELSRLRPQDSVHLLLSGNPPRKMLPDFTTDPEIARKAILDIPQSFRSNDTDRAILKAQQLLSHTRAPQTEILLMTDLAGPPPSPESLTSLTATLRIIGVAEPPGPNRSIESIEIQPGNAGHPGEVTFAVRIRNDSDTPANDLRVELHLHQTQVASGRITLAAQATETKEFFHRFEEKGVYHGFVRIPDDAMSADNQRYFIVDIRESVRVLLISGDSRPGSHRDETYYLSRALSTPVDGLEPLSVDLVDPEIARSTPLDPYDIIFLAGVSELSATLGDRLSSRVTEGGGLFVSAPDRRPQWNPIAQILPARISGVQTYSRSPFRIGAIDFTHPVFSEFSNELTGLENLDVTSVLVSEPDARIERAVIARLQNGMPLLFERTVARGRVLLLTTTLDRDWTTLPIQPGFLPLVQRATRYLAGSLHRQTLRMVHVGDAVSLEILEGMQKLILLTPDDRKIEFSASRLSGETRLQVTDTGLPGTYRVWARMPDYGGLVEMSDYAFSVNVAEAESRLEATYPDSKDISGDHPDIYAAAKGKMPVWSWLLLVGILLILAEGFLSGVGLRRHHRPR
jgi:hypothetical protein